MLKSSPSLLKGRLIKLMRLNSTSYTNNYLMLKSALWRVRQDRLLKGLKTSKLSIIVSSNCCFTIRPLIEYASTVTLPYAIEVLSTVGSMLWPWTRFHMPDPRLPKLLEMWGMYV